MRQNIKYLAFYSVFASLMCITGTKGEYLKTFLIVYTLMFFALFATENLTGILNYRIKMILIILSFFLLNFYILTVPEEKDRYAVYIIEGFWISLAFLNLFIKKRLNSLIEDEILKWIALYFILVISQKILNDVYMLVDIDIFDMIVTTFLWRIISIVLHFKEEKYIHDNV